jgi:Ca2+-binding RTX toxin-like protein
MPSRRTLAVAVAAAALAACALAPAANAASTCTPVADGLRVDVDAAATLGDRVTVATRAPYGAIVVIDRDGSTVFCGESAQTVLVDHITVVSPVRTGLGLDLREGPLAPGRTPEATGEGEIEVTLKAPRRSTLWVAGDANLPSTISLGTAALALNADDDADVTLPAGLAGVQVDGGIGADELSAAGGHGTGAKPFAQPFVVHAGPGSDVVTGGAGDDSIATSGYDPAWPDNNVVAGGAGDDTIYGGEGADDLRGGPGDDHLEGFAFNDVLRGEGGNDVLIDGQDADTLLGGAGNDSLTAYDGHGDDTVDGGAGRDAAWVDLTDPVTRVERLDAR